MKHNSTLLALAPSKRTLGEHYESLRWYTAMQHYRIMKTSIGGTKSFASRIYNQQFQGTFKKIRHLFSITPEFISPNLATKEINLVKNSFLNPTTPLNNSNISHSQGNLSILRYDQPLYNEYKNKKMSCM